MVILLDRWGYATKTLAQPAASPTQPRSIGFLHTNRESPRCQPVASGEDGRTNFQLYPQSDRDRVFDFYGLFC
jgi:hypothetical protein